MRPHALITLIAAPIAVVLIACGTGASSETTSGSGGGAPAAVKSPVTIAAGQTMTLTETILGTKTVAEITLSNVKFGVKATDGFSKPAKGQFITADVSVVVKEGKYSINSSQFKLVATDGTAYDSTLALDGKDLSANDLTSGQKTTGSITFDAAKDAQTGGKIALKSFLAEGDAGYWTL